MSTIEVSLTLYEDDWVQFDAQWTCRSWLCGQSVRRYYDIPPSVTSIVLMLSSDPERDAIRLSDPRKDYLKFLRIGDHSRRTEVMPCLFYAVVDLGGTAWAWIEYDEAEVTA